MAIFQPYLAITKLLGMTLSLQQKSSTVWTQSLVFIWQLLLANMQDYIIKEVSAEEDELHGTVEQGTEMEEEKGALQEARL